MSSYPPTDPSQSTPVYTETLSETPYPESTETLRVTSDDASDTSVDDARSSAPSEATATAKSAAQSAVSTSKDQAKEVASEVKSQTSDLLHTTASELRDQAATQQQRVAEGLRAVSDEFGAMAARSESSGVASELVTNLSKRSSDVAAWLDERDPGSLLDEVKSFAARRPGAFIAIAAGAGIVAGRLAKSLAASASDDSEKWAPTCRTPIRRRRRPRRHSATSSAGYLKTSPRFFQEVELAKAELSESAKKAGKGAGMLGGAGVAGAFALLFLSIAAWWGLGYLIGNALSAVLITIVYAIVALILFLNARKNMKSVKGAPQTVDSLKKIPQTLKPGGTA